MKISITIGRDGNVKVNDVEGAGSGCQAETADVEAALGLVDEASRSTTDSAFVENDPLKLTQSQ